MLANVGERVSARAGLERPGNLRAAPRTPPRRRPASRHHGCRIKWLIAAAAARGGPAVEVLACRTDLARHRV